MFNLGGGIGGGTVIYAGDDGANKHAAPFFKNSDSSLRSE
jgi:hypothetical protein